VPAATNATLTLSNIALDPGGDYSVVITNSFGAVTSAIAPVTVVRFLPTVDVTAALGARVSFSVLKNGRPITVRWSKDGQSYQPDSLLTFNLFEMPLVLPDVVNTNAGQYCVLASNQWGVVQPPCSTLTVVAPGPLDALHPIGQLPPGQFSNLEQQNGSFFALGAYQIATSIDGINWNVASNFPAIFWDVSGGEGKYVAVGEIERLYTSSDGLSWSPGTISAFGQLRAVTHGATGFVVAAQSAVFSSSDGSNWTRATSAIPDLFQDVTWGGDRFVLISVNGRIQSSTDGVAWEANVTEPVGYLYSVTYGNGRFVAVGSEGLTMSSADGMAWQSHYSGTVEWFTKVTYGYGLFLGITRSGSMLSSPDGISWTMRAYNYSGLVCPANGAFLVGGSNNTLLETGPLAMLQMLPAPNFGLQIHGPVGRQCRIESTDSFASATTWRTRESFTLPVSPFNWVDPEPAVQQRFYRVVLP